MLKKLASSLDDNFTRQWNELVGKVTQLCKLRTDGRIILHWVGGVPCLALGDVFRTTQLHFTLDESSSETVPAYGVMLATDVADRVTLGKVETKKPSTTFGRTWLVNSGSPIVGGNSGTAQIHDYVEVLYDTGTPAAGETWGPKPGQWTLSKGYPGFRCVGVVDGSAKIMLAVREEPPFYLCKADSSISKGSTGTASVYYDASGTPTDSTVNIANCKALWGAIATSKWCGVSFVNGVPYITQLEC